MAAPTIQSARAMSLKMPIAHALRRFLALLALWILLNPKCCSALSEDQTAPGNFSRIHEGELRAERISWQGGICEFRALSLQTPVGSVRCQQGVFQLPSSSLSGTAELGEIHLTSSQIPHLQLPRDLKCLKWSLKSPSASLKFGAGRRLSQLQLAPELQATFTADGGQAQNASKQQFFAQLTAGDLLLNRDGTTEASDCQLRVEFLENTSARGGKTGGVVCAVDQIKIDAPDRSACLSPAMTLRGPGVYYRQNGSLEARLINTPTCKQDKNAVRIAKQLRLMGQGATDFMLEGFSIFDAKLFAPGGFCLDATRQCLQLLPNAQPLTFSGQIDGQLLQLQGNLANIHWNQAGKTTFEGVIEQNVQFTLANRKSDGNFTAHHRVLAESLAFDTSLRALTFASSFPKLVRYTNFDNPIALTAPTLRICMPAKGDVQLSGEGVVQARLRLDPKFLSPLKSPNWR